MVTESQVDAALDRYHLELLGMEPFEHLDQHAMRRILEAADEVRTSRQA